MADTQTEAPPFEEYTDGRGRRRLRVRGRSGFPAMIRKAETAEDAYLRITAEDAAKQAAAAEAPPSTASAKRSEPSASDQPATAAPSDDRARPKGSDPKPRGGRPVGKPRPATKELEAVLAELLVLPAIPMGLPVRDPTQDRIVEVEGQPGGALIPGFRPRCQYCRDHFIHTGPQAAAELAKLSEESEPLRALLERLHAAWSMISVGSVLAGYLAKPVLHHLAPEPVLDGVGPALGVPPRPPRPPAHDHDHDHPEDDAPFSPAAPAGPAAAAVNGAATPGASPHGF